MQCRFHNEESLFLFNRKSPTLQTTKTFDSSVMVNVAWLVQALLPQNQKLSWQKAILSPVKQLVHESVLGVPDDGIVPPPATAATAAIPFQ